jgi:hypothetical protein
MEAGALLYYVHPTGGILMLPGSLLANHVGELLITDAGEYDPLFAALYLTHWDGTNFATWRIPYLTNCFNGGAGRFEQVTFAPIDIPTMNTAP